MKKRIVSVVLAAAMLCAMLTVFASASQDASFTCTICGCTLTYAGVVPGRYEYGYYSVLNCSYVAGTHNHRNTYTQTQYICMNIACCQYGHVMAYGKGSLVETEYCTVANCLV